MMERGTARQWARYGKRFYFGVDVHLYEVSVGVSLRWFEGAEHVRLYLGPVKVYAGRMA